MVLTSKSKMTWLETWRLIECPTVYEQTTITEYIVWQPTGYGERDLFFSDEPKLLF